MLKENRATLQMISETVGNNGPSMLSDRLSMYKIMIIIQWNNRQNEMERQLMIIILLFSMML